MKLSPFLSEKGLLHAARQTREVVDMFFIRIMNDMKMKKKLAIRS